MHLITCFKVLGIIATLLSYTQPYHILSSQEELVTAETILASLNVQEKLLSLNILLSVLLTNQDDKKKYQISWTDYVIFDQKEHKFRLKEFVYPPSMRTVKLSLASMLNILDCGIMPNTILQRHPDQFSYEITTYLQKHADSIRELTIVLYREAKRNKNIQDITISPDRFKEILYALQIVDLANYLADEKGDLQGASIGMFPSLSSPRNIELSFYNKLAVLARLFFTEKTRSQDIICSAHIISPLLTNYDQAKRYIAEQTRTRRLSFSWISYTKSGSHIAPINSNIVQHTIEKPVSTSFLYWSDLIDVFLNLAVCNELFARAIMLDCINMTPGKVKEYAIKLQQAIPEYPYYIVPNISAQENEIVLGKLILGEHGVIAGCGNRKSRSVIFEQCLTNLKPIVNKWLETHDNSQEPSENISDIIQEIRASLLTKRYLEQLDLKLANLTAKERRVVSLSGRVRNLNAKFPAEYFRIKKIKDQFIARTKSNTISLQLDADLLLLLKILFGKKIIRDCLGLILDPDFRYRVQGAPTIYLKRDGLHFIQPQQEHYGFVYEDADNDNAYDMYDRRLGHVKMRAYNAGVLGVIEPHIMQACDACNSKLMHDLYATLTREDVRKLLLNKPKGKKANKPKQLQQVQFIVVSGRNIIIISKGPGYNPETLLRINTLPSETNYYHYAVSGLLEFEQVMPYSELSKLMVLIWNKIAEHNMHNPDYSGPDTPFNKLLDLVGICAGVGMPFKPIRILYNPYDGEEIIYGWVLREKSNGALTKIQQHDNRTLGASIRGVTPSQLRETQYSLGLYEEFKLLESFMRDMSRILAASSSHPLMNIGPSAPKEQRLVAAKLFAAKTNNTSVILDKTIWRYRLSCLYKTGALSSIIACMILSVAIVWLGIWASYITFSYHNKKAAADKQQMILLGLLLLCLYCITSLIK